jgi:hypothetical protein
MPVGKGREGRESTLRISTSDYIYYHDDHIRSKGDATMNNFCLNVFLQIENRGGTSSRLCLNEWSKSSIQTTKWDSSGVPQMFHSNLS